MSAAKRIVVAGAGPAGILMGIRLLERGYTNFTIYEKQDDLGGTWLRNRYPGNACDVPALNYSFSFQPNIKATHTYEGGRQLQAYFRELAESHGVDDYIIYNTEVVDATWDGVCWRITTGNGTTEEVDVFISAVGRLHRPRIPDFPGMDSFRGLITHSTFWDDSYQLEGKRLGVIGSGSTGVQIVTQASKEVAHLDFFQRTPQWVLPIENEEISEEIRQRLAEDPEFVQQSFNDLEVWLEEITNAVVDSESAEALKRNQDCYDALATVKDPVLRAKLTPDYAVGCKRLVMSGEFYRQVQQPNVEVITERIERIEPEGIRTADGVLHELDVIILATGFYADSYLRPMTVTGQDGKTLDDIWAKEYMNYKSVALPYMPNLFLINGPFSPGGSVSVLMIIESHVNYIMQLIDRVATENVAIAPDWHRSETLLRQVQHIAMQTVWYTGGCTSWYLDSRTGVPIVNPMSLEQLRADMKAPIFDDFVITPLPRAALR